MQRSCRQYIHDMDKAAQEAHGRLWGERLVAVKQARSDISCRVRSPLCLCLSLSLSLSLFLSRVFVSAPKRWPLHSGRAPSAQRGSWAPPCPVQGSAPFSGVSSACPSRGQSCC